MTEPTQLNPNPNPTPHGPLPRGRGGDTGHQRLCPRSTSYEVISYVPMCQRYSTIIIRSDLLTDARCPTCFRTLNQALRALRSYVCLDVSIDESGAGAEPRVHRRWPCPRARVESDGHEARTGGAGNYGGAAVVVTKAGPGCISTPM